MATGPVSSANNLGAAPQKTLVAGEKVATTAAALKDPNAKTYFHQVPGSRFIMPNGLEVVFMGGRFTTADKDIQAELDQVANRSTSLIFTQKEGLAAADANDKKAAADAAEAAKTDSEVK